MSLGAARARLLRLPTGTAARGRGFAVLVPQVASTVPADRDVEQPVPVRPPLVKLAELKLHTIDRERPDLPHLPTQRLRFPWFPEVDVAMVLPCRDFVVGPVADDLPREGSPLVRHQVVTVVLQLPE